MFIQQLVILSKQQAIIVKENAASHLAAGTVAAVELDKMLNYPFE